MQAKKPGPSMVSRPIELHLEHDRPRGRDAYDRLIGDALRGDPALFARQDGVMEAWRVVEQVLDVTNQRVAVTQPYKRHRRMTLTFPAFERVGSILWIVAGADKTSMLERLLAADPTIPAGRVPQERAVLITDGVLGS